MRKVLGIIAEYNPFHNGHLYHLNKSKQITNSDFTIAVISGNFMQRGTPSLLDKWTRAELAIKNGIDLVLELPVLYATSSAENFAEGAIKILNSLKIVDNISFGAETPDINILNNFAEVLYKEPKEFKGILSHELSKGISYPKARQNALMIYLNDIQKHANILSSPNNILGIEYLKALKKYKSNITPVCIQRIKSNHHDSDFSGNIASATAIRNLILKNNSSDLKNLLSIDSYSILQEKISNGQFVKNISTFEKEIIYNLRKMSLAEISNLPDVSEGLENALKKAANSSNNISDFINEVSTKRYTRTRIHRILLYSILNITKKHIQISQKTIPYSRVLGFNQKGKFLLSEIISANPQIELITSIKKYIDSNPPKNLLSLLEKDIWATNVYTLGFTKSSFSNLDYTHKIVTI